MFFDSGFELLGVIIVGICAYVSLIVLLRISGKRTLSKMNAFDLVVTVALGSILATVLLSSDVALLEGITAFVILIAMQFIIAWLSVRSPVIRRIVKSEPTLLFYQGQFLHAAMMRERVTENEIYAAIRAQGFGAVENVEAVVLETDGTVTVVSVTQNPPTALHGVEQSPI